MQPRYEMFRLKTGNNKTNTTLWNKVHHHHLFGTPNMVQEVQLVNNNMTEQLNSDPRTLKAYSACKPRSA